MPQGKGFRIYVEIPDTPGVSLNYEGSITFERLWREFEFAKKLKHASAIRIIYLGQNDVAIVMHYWRPSIFVTMTPERAHQNRIFRILAGLGDSDD